MSWITNRELVSRGVPQTSINEAVQGRKLKGTRLSNEEMAFDCASVDAWLAGRPAGVDASAAKQSLASYQREERETIAREQASRPVSSAPSAVTPVSQQRSAEETLACLVDHVAAQENTGEAEARQKVLRGSPDLRERLVAEANADRPLRGTRARPDLADRAAALHDAIPTR